VSHQPTQIREHCNVFYVLHDGRIERFDDADQAYAYYLEQG
jgi:ABC-type polysaccharide/polyol phosphate transport system ATPase subunit